MTNITQLLHDIDEGDPQAASELLPLVYEELRKLAAAKMANERMGHTLQGTALVHEAYVRVVETDQEQNWNSRGHFFSAAAEAMRRILVEQARRKKRQKHGGDHQRIELSHAMLVSIDSDQEILTLNEALEDLEALDPRAADVVKLRFFAGLSRQEVAEILGVSVSTIDDEWVYAKNWLRVALSR